METSQLFESHLLMLPIDTDPEDVAALVLTRHPDATVSPEVVDFGRHTRLFGPFMLDEAAFPELPHGRPLVYALDCPKEREPVPMPGVFHPDGLHRAFPGGLPIRAEGRSIELLIGLARRLDGVVWVPDSQTALQPSPEQVVNLTVYSAEWIGPEELLAALQTRAPETTLALDAHPWAGPPDDIADNPVQSGGPLLPLSMRIALHQAAERVDREASEAPDELDGYAAVLDLGRFGLIEVQAHLVEVEVTALRGFDWAPDAISYAVLWHWHDGWEPVQENPSPEYREARDVAVQAVDALASAAADATHGVIVDADGFLVDRYHL